MRMDATSTTTAGLAGAPADAARGEAVLTAAACRALDIGVAAVLLLLLLPLFAVIALAIRLDSPGRVFFRQRRVGRSLEPFTINKFRTMQEGVDHERHKTFVLGLIAGDGPDPSTDRPMFKIVKDDRVTRVGGRLRRSSLDELPQLWNVLRGDMSLVGPRPPINYEVEHYPSHWFGRFGVKPGLTGLWQVSGRSQTTLEAMISFDLEYAEHRSLWLNVRILLRTIPVVMLRRGAA
jgi:lipopolysaccharide/colanic/teichoic acid biosynthesis glycosyltransferase